MNLAARLVRVSDLVDRVVVVVCAGLVVAMLGISVTGILHQAATGNPLVWTSSTARLLLPWLAMLSVTVALKRGEHIALGIAVGRLPSSLRRACGWLGLIVLGLFGAALVWYGSALFVASTQLHMISDQLQVSSRWMAAAVPVSGAVICVHLLCGPRLLAMAGARKEPAA